MGSIENSWAFGFYFRRRIAPLKSNHKIVLLHLASVADEEGIAKPSYERMSLYTELSDKTVKRVILDLEEAGEIEIASDLGIPSALEDKTGKKRFQRTNAYRLTHFANHNGYDYPPGWDRGVERRKAEKGLGLESATKGGARNRAGVEDAQSDTPPNLGGYQEPEEAQFDTPPNLGGDNTPPNLGGVDTINLSNKNSLDLSNDKSTGKKPFQRKGKPTKTDGLSIDLPTPVKVKEASNLAPGATKPEPDVPTKSESKPERKRAKRDRLGNGKGAINLTEEQHAQFTALWDAYVAWREEIGVPIQGKEWGEEQRAARLFAQRGYAADLRLALESFEWYHKHKWGAGTVHTLQAYTKHFPAYRSARKEGRIAMEASRDSGTITATEEEIQQGIDALLELGL